MRALNGGRASESAELLRDCACDIGYGTEGDRDEEEDLLCVSKMHG